MLLYLVEVTHSTLTMAMDRLLEAVRVRVELPPRATTTVSTAVVTCSQWLGHIVRVCRMPVPVEVRSDWCFACSVCGLRKCVLAKAMQEHSAESGTSAWLGLHYLLQILIETNIGLCRS